MNKYSVRYMDSLGVSGFTEIESSHFLNRKEIEGLLIEQLLSNGIYVDWLQVTRIKWEYIDTDDDLFSAVILQEQLHQQDRGIELKKTVVSALRGINFVLWGTMILLVICSSITFYGLGKLKGYSQADLDATYLQQKLCQMRHKESINYQKCLDTPITLL